MSVVVIDTIEPKNNGSFPVVKQWHVLGGRGRIVADITARNAIPAEHREIGMEVKVLDAPGEKSYKLSGGIANGDWVEVSGDYIPTSAYNAANGVPQLDGDGFINSAQIRNLFINDSYVVADEAARLALTTYTGNVVVQEDTGEVWFKRNNDNPADVGDFYLLSTAGAVVSVNGQTGVVSITIANLLAVGANLTAFNNAVAASPHATSVDASLSAINTELDNLQTQIDNLSALDASLWKGVYDAGKTYQIGEYIEGADGLFYRVIAVTTGNAPPNATYYVRAGNYYSQGEIGSLLGAKANAADVLTKNNTTPYTPSATYHPATVKFVTDLVQATGIAKNNYAATTNPTVNDDVSQGYSVGSEWYNTATQIKFFCTNAASGAAVWVSQLFNQWIWDFNNQTGTTYTAVAADAGKVVRVTNSSAIAVTIPANATVPYEIGTRLKFRQGGAGVATISPAGGVTFNGPFATVKTDGINTEVEFVKRGTNEWDVITSRQYQTQDGKKNYAVATGTNTYAVTLDPVPTALTAGFKISVLFTNGNTSGATLNPNSYGPITIVKNLTTPLVSGDIPDNEILDLTYDGTNFRINPKRASQVPITPIPEIAGSNVQAALSSLKSYVDTEILSALYQVKRITIEDSEILTANTSPIEIVAAPVGDIMLNPLRVVADFTPGTTPYATNTDVEIYLGNTLIATFTGILANTDRTISVSSGFEFEDDATEFIQQPLTFKVPGGNPTAGDGFIRIHLAYEAVQLLNFEDETLAILQEGFLQGYTLPPTSDQISLNDDVVKYLKDNGVWEKIDFLHIYGSNGDADFGCINLKLPTGAKATRAGGLTHSHLGLEGNGTNGHIKTGYNPSIDAIKYLLNDASMGLFVSVDPSPGESTIVMGALTSISNNRIILQNTNPRMQINGGALATTTGITNTTGLFAVTRISSSTMHRYYGTDNRYDTPGVSSVAIVNGELYVLSYSLDGIATGFSPKTVFAAFAGAHLTETELNYIETALNAYKTAITP